MFKKDASIAPTVNSGHRFESSYYLPIKLEPHTVAVATSTLYPQWHSERKCAGGNLSDKVRGDLSLETFGAIKEAGYHLVLVDGGSSKEYIRELKARDISPLNQNEPLLSGSRRQAMREASIKDRINYIVTMEPEKVDFVQHIPLVLGPIADGSFDIIVPHRDQASFKTYPDYQAEYEQRSNQLWNAILQSQGFYKKDFGSLDAWFGNRLMVNRQDVLNLFLAKYRFKEQSNGRLLEVTKPEMWANALFLPLIAALNQGFRVGSVEVPYRHPAAQTDIEQNNDFFKRKRAIQRKDIITSTIHYIRHINGDPKSKMISAD